MLLLKPACILAVRRRAPEGSYFRDGIGILGLGYIMFLGTAIWIATSPVSLAI